MFLNMIVGAVLGFLAGLGVGGGSLLILWLTLVCHTEPETARLMNLLFFLPCALTAIPFRLRQGSVPFRKLLPAIAAGCAAAFCFSLLGRHLDTKLLKKLFGMLLIFTGLRELFYKAK